MVAHSENVSPSSNRASDRRRSPAVFVGLAFAISWTIWALLFFPKLKEAYFLQLLFAGSFGPAIAALGLLLARGKPGETASFLIRLVRVDWVLLRWLPLILLFFPAILLVGLALTAWLGGEAAPTADYLSGVTKVSDLLALLGLMVLGGPLGEEPGWRGYLLEPLQQRFGAVRASLLIAAIWTSWHLPLFFIEGTSQFDKGLGLASLSWVIQLGLASLFATAMYDRTGRSILAAILIHLTANVFYPLGLDAGGEVVFSIVRVVFAIAVAAWLLRRERAAERVGAGAEGRDP